MCSTTRCHTLCPTEKQRPYLETTSGQWRQHPDIGTEEDSIHQLDRAAQVTIIRLITGHCQLFSHLHRLKISHSDECPFGTSPQTPNHILQSCPTFNALWHQTWPSLVNAHRKLWGPVKTLTHQTEDLAWLGTQKQKTYEFVCVCACACVCMCVCVCV